MLAPFSDKMFLVPIKYLKLIFALKAQVMYNIYKDKEQKSF